MPLQTEWWKGVEAGEEAGGAALASGTKGAWVAQKPPPQPPSQPGVAPYVQPPPPVLPPSVLQLGVALGRRGEETFTGGATWPPFSVLAPHLAVPWSGGATVTAPEALMNPTATAPFGAELREPSLWPRGQAVVLPVQPVDRATLWGPLDTTQRPQPRPQGGEEMRADDEGLRRRQDGTGGAEVVEGPGQAGCRGPGEVSLVTRQVGSVDNLDLAYESCCRSMAQLSVGRKIDSARCQLLA